MSHCKHHFEIVGVDQGKVIYCCIHCGHLKSTSIFWANKERFSPYRFEVVNA